jgi:protein-L-isoaspartate(D-aspartate) O-methyltransferase
VKYTLIILNFLIFPIFLFSCSADNVKEKSDKDYKAMREEMVEHQIKERGIKNKLVLDSMLKVERDRFIPDSCKDEAYSDSPLPIGEGQTISQPYIVALMTECLVPKADHKILEIGTGSGYQAAVLANIVREVYTIEIVETLANSAKELLKNLGYKNVEVKCGDGFAGWKEKAPFDGIVVTAACDKVPQPLFDQLKEGGRMAIPIGSTLNYQTLTIITKENSKMKKSSVTGVIFVPLTGDHGFGK